MKMVSGFDEAMQFVVQKQNLDQKCQILSHFESK
jgi:hypothetical protein